MARLAYLSRTHKTSNPLPPAHASLLRKLAEEDGMYLLRAGSASISVPACLLLASGTRERVVAHLDHDGNVVALAYVFRAASCGNWKRSGKKADKGTTTLKSEIVFTEGVELKGADVPSLGELKAQAEAEASVDNRPWYLKYWMYIAGGVLLLAVLG